MLLMADYGVWNALNLDGGGSTSMALEDPVTHARSMVNVSSDRDYPGGSLGRQQPRGVRAVANP